MSSFRCQSPTTIVWSGQLLHARTDHLRVGVGGDDDSVVQGADETFISISSLFPCWWEVLM